MSRKTVLIALAALAGCSPTVDQPVAAAVSSSTTSPEPTESPRAAAGPPATRPPSVDGPRDLPIHIDENLARLRALNVIDVGEMIAPVPPAAARDAACREGSKAPPTRCLPSADARRAAARRLGAFTRAAGKAATTPAAEGEDAVKNFDANLAALRSLKIVEVRGLVHDNPQNAFNCYGECEPSSDGERRRARALAAIVAATKDL